MLKQNCSPLFTGSKIKNYFEQSNKMNKNNIQLLMKKKLGRFVISKSKEEKTTTAICYNKITIKIKLKTTKCIYLYLNKKYGGKIQRNQIKRKKL